MTVTISIDSMTPSSAFVRTMKRLVVLLIIAFVVLDLLFNAIGVGTDDSDQDGFHRSGFSVRTDYKTGLQYLVTPDGGIAQRMDADGHQIRVR